MNFPIVKVSFLVLVMGIGTTNYALGEIDPLTEISFLQTGTIFSDKNEFHISNEIVIREFFNGNIIRVSGQTIEGFPYITYSKISDDNIDTHGIIFVNNQFLKLSFSEKVNNVEEIHDKNDDLSVAVQYTQRVYSKQVIFLDVKIFEKDQNKHAYFNQNYGYKSDVDIHVTITDEENQEVFSSVGITNENGLYETEYPVPDNSKRETLTISINAENENSSSSKILQVFSLGNRPNTN